MMRQYEALMLTVPEITGDEVKNLEMQLDKVVKAGTGNTISFERWGKYKLAYEINKSDYGVFFLTRFELPAGSQSSLESIKNLLKVKLNNVVMRDMLSVLDPQRPLHYQRPRSLEEAPTREAELSKDNKINSFLSMDERDEMDED
jgi:ribosomal protein S6